MLYKLLDSRKKKKNLKCERILSISNEMERVVFSWLHLKNAIKMFIV